MGILHIIVEVCNFHQVSWKNVLKKSLITTTQSSWEEIRVIQLAMASEDRTVRWARVINNSYFMRLNILNHITLASLMIESYIKAQGNDGILNSNWAKLHKSTAAYYRQASQRLFDHLTGTTEKVVGGTKEAQILADLINTSHQL
ncbi:unnamed protein product [Chilo suppressalis]|uniref:Uncharacterized protein n=1 Tax=Chilo suppressalis TaxID=168631 RepID=A0ABN8LDC7_CHISP|nr:unnamed protein product [Chilo suppressalis]